MKRLVLTGIIALLSSVGAAWARPIEDGVAAFKRGDYVTALRLFRALATKGDAKAQSNLGVLYANGDGGTQDFVRAHMWFDRSAASGDAIAATNLDIAKHRMTPQQIAQAKKWPATVSSANSKDATKTGSGWAGWTVKAVCNLRQSSLAFVVGRHLIEVFI